MKIPCRFRQAVTAFSLIIVALAFCELVIRLFTSIVLIYDVEMTRYALNLKQPSPDPLIAFSQRADAEGSFMGVRLKTNAQGWRNDHDFSERPAADTERIEFLGDSLTLGWGVDEKETFAARLQSKWRAEGRKIEVANLGQGNFNTVQVTRTYETSGARYHPACVVYYYFLNDAEEIQNSTGWSWLGHSRVVTLIWSRLRILAPSVLGMPVDFHSYYRNLYQDREAGWHKGQAALLRLRDLTRQNGARLAVVLLPDLHEVHPYPFVPEHQKIMNVLRNANIRALDLANAFADVDEARSLWVHFDDTHPNSLAHAIIALKTAPFLEDCLGPNGEARESAH